MAYGVVCRAIRLSSYFAFPVVLLVVLAGQAFAQTTRSNFSRDAEQEIRFQEGLLHYTRGELQLARNEFQQQVNENPGDSEAYYYLGLSQLDSGHPAEAVGNFDQSLRLDSTRTEVHGARATALIRLHRFTEAEQDLAILQTDPKWASLTAYTRGQLLYTKGDLEGAAKEFAKARDLGGTEQEPAEFYEGLTYLRMRELVRARETFRNAGTSAADRDPTVAAASRQLDAVLAAQQTTRKPWEIQVSAGWEYDTNVILLGTGVATPAGISNKSDGRFVIQPRGSYSLYREGNLEFGVEANGYFSFQNSLSAFDISSYQAGPFVNYKINNNLYASARYGFNYLEFGHDPFLKRHIVTPQLTYLEPKFGYTSVYYQFQSREFEGSENTPFDRDGHNNIIGIVQGFTLGSIFKEAGPATFELSYRFENQTTQGSDFDGNFHTLGATVYTPLPWLGLRADAGVTATYEGYSHPNSLDADGDARRDVELTFSAGLTKEIFKNTSLRVDYQYTNRNSDVTTALDQSPYEYDRNVIGVRVIYSY